MLRYFQLPVVTRPRTETPTPVAQPAVEEAAPARAAQNPTAHLPASGRYAPALTLVVVVVAAAAAAVAAPGVDSWM